jgi:methyl-accepting chemotaxis protein
MSRPIPFRRTLLGQALFFGVLPAALVVLMVSGINGQRAMRSIASRIERDLASESAAAVREIELRNGRNIELVRMMSMAQESGQFGRRAETLRMLERVMRTNPTVYAAYIAYEPGADGQDAAGVQAGVPANALGEGGRFYPYFKRDPKSPSGFRLEPLQETEDDGGLWYRVPKQRFERSGVVDAVITKPYTYLGTDIIEHVVPIVRDGRFLGVAGLDIALTDLQARLDEIAQRLDADVCLETRGYFVAATTDTTADRDRVEATSLVALLAARVTEAGDRPAVVDGLAAGRSGDGPGATAASWTWQELAAAAMRVAESLAEVSQCQTLELGELGQGWAQGLADQQEGLVVADRPWSPPRCASAPSSSCRQS